MQGGDQRLELGPAEELDLVEQQHEPRGRLTPRRLANREQHIGEVEREVVVVGDAVGRFDVEAGVPRAVLVDLEREGSQHRRRAPHALTPLRLGRQLEQGGAQPQAEVASELLVVVLAHLELEDHPIGALGLGAELPEQHGLSDTAQTGDDHRLLGASPGEAGQHQVEGLELVVATDDGLRSGSGVRGVGISEAVHRQILARLVDFSTTR